MNKAKMSGHSRAVMSAAETMQRVLSGMNDAPFMQEGTSTRTEDRQRLAEMARQVVGDAPQSVLERVGREMEQAHGRV